MIMISNFLFIACGLWSDFLSVCVPPASVDNCPIFRHAIKIGSRKMVPEINSA